MGEKQKKLSHKKAEKEKKEENTELTKPKKVYKFLADPQSKLYALFLKRAIPLFETANQNFRGKNRV